MSSATAMMSSSSANNTTTSQNNLPTATFDTVFDMVMLNGSALHKHQISNFTLTSMSMPDKKNCCIQWNCHNNYERRTG